MISRMLLCVSLTSALVASEPPRLGPGDQGGKGTKGPSPEELFTMADADGDGKVTKAELATALERPRRDDRDKMFAKIDANGDGTISKDEFAAFEPPAPPGQEDGEKNRRRPGPNVDEMFKRMDRNGDGSITKDEMAARPGKDFFEEADTNKDGQLSKEEIQAARERMMQEHGDRREPDEKKP